MFDAPVQTSQISTRANLSAILLVDRSIVNKTSAGVTVVCSSLKFHTDFRIQMHAKEYEDDESHIVNIERFEALREKEKIIDMTLKVRTDVLKNITLNLFF